MLYCHNLITASIGRKIREYVQFNFCCQAGMLKDKLHNATKMSLLLFVCLQFDLDVSICFFYKMTLYGMEPVFS